MVGRWILLGMAAAATAALTVVPERASPALTVPLIAAAALAIAGLLMLESKRALLKRGPILLISTALILFAMVFPPRHSNDVWSYSMYGRMVAWHHVSPYTHVPADFGRDSLLKEVSPGWRHTPSVYGPAFVVLA